MKNLCQLLVFGYIVGAVPALISAASLGLNFAATDPDAATSSLMPNEVAGVVPQANWNNLEGATGSSSAPLVYDNAGTPVESTATVSWSGPNTWRSSAAAPNQFPVGPDRKLLSGYLDSNEMTGAGNVSMVSVSNIDAAVGSPAYDVYVYFLGDSTEDRGGGYTLTPSVGDPIVMYGSTLAEATAHVEDPGTDMDNSMDGTYLKFAGLTAPSFTLTGDATLTMPNGFRAPINAVQIVQAGPPPVLGDTNGNMIGGEFPEDFDPIRENFRMMVAAREEGDLVRNGVVDFDDFHEWKTAFLGNGGSLAGVDLSIFTNVPEPASGLLLLIGATALVCYRSREQGVRSRE